jgi:hypothetical protein
MKIFKTYFFILTLTLILGACEKDPVCPPTDNNNNNTHNCDTSFNIFGFWGLKTVNTVIFDLVQDSPIDTLDFLYPNNFVLMELGKDFKGYQYQNRNVVDSFNYYFDSTKLIVFRQPLKPTNDTFQIIKFDKSNLQMIQRNKDYTNMIRTESKVSFERQ